MNIRRFIRSIIEERLQLVQEAKDRLIRRIPDENMTDEQKEFLIDLYAKDPNLEKVGNIDWNRLDKLTWDSFQPIINHEYDSPSHLRKSAKNAGIEGLKIGRDYVPLKKIDRVDELQGAYIPLTYDASRIIASADIGGCVGEWCSATQRTSKDWNKYIFKDGIVLVYLVYEGEKWALAIYGNNEIWEVFDMHNDPHRHLPGLDVDQLIQDNAKQIDDIREHLSKDENLPVDIMGGFSGTKYKVNSNGSVDVYGNVNLAGKKLKELPIKYNEIDGNFDISGNQLTSLHGCPVTVKGDFSCNDNMGIRSLEGGPEEVGGSFSCSFTSIIDLSGGPEIVGGDYNAARCGLIKLTGAPKEIEGVFRVSGNNITTLIGGPVKVGSSFMVQQNKLESLEGAPKSVGGKFTCSRNVETFTIEDVQLVCDVDGEISV